MKIILLLAMLTALLTTGCVSGHHDHGEINTPSQPSPSPDPIPAPIPTPHPTL